MNKKEIKQNLENKKIRRKFGKNLETYGELSPLIIIPFNFSKITYLFEEKVKAYQEKNQSMRKNKVLQIRTLLDYI